MLQDIPLNYPSIITKYLQDRVDTIKFDEGDGGSINDNFDKVAHNGTTYEFDIEENDEIVRITDLDTQAIYNITKYDCREDYHAMPHLVSLLDYIETNTKFSVTDWLGYFIKPLPVYMGNLINIYTIKPGKYIITTSSGDLGFFVGDTSVVPLQDIVINSTLDSVDIVVDIKFTQISTTDVATICPYSSSTLLGLFNAEHSFSKIPVEHRRQLPVINPEVLNNPNRLLDLFGMPVTLAETSVTFTLADRQFRVSNEGGLYIEYIKEDVTPSLGMNYGTMFMRINTQEDIDIATSVILLLNKIFALVE